MNMMIKINIWGRDFELNCDYYNFPDEEVTENQKRTLDKIERINFDEAREKVIEYIKQSDSDKLVEAEISNLFKYIIPKKILIFREEEKRVLAVMCDYRFDEEHGIAIMFEDEKFTFVGKQDEVL